MLSSAKWWTKRTPETRAGEPQWPPHFDGNRFFNPGVPQARGLLDVLRWKWTTRPERSPQMVHDVEPSVPLHRVQNDSLQITLVNHATVLLQQREFNVLTDPVWSNRASPLRWIGPRRRRIPGVRQEDLPAIDVVLLSHNHYDHLDLTTLRWLAKRNDCEFLVPLGLGRLLRKSNIEKVHELDWGRSKMIGGTVFHCAPAVHFSARTPFDRNRTLWCGYVIETQARIIYFAGDTAFGDHFSQIRELFGPPDLSLLPIGAYAPRWFMSRIHMAPSEALRAHHVLGSAISVAIHHGTFQLSDEAIDEPKRQLSKLNLPDSFLLLNNGQSATLA